MSCVSRRVVRGLGACAAAGLLTALLPLAQQTAVATTSTQTPVMGPNVLDAPQLAAWYRSKRGSTPANVPALNNDVQALAQIFIDEGRADGVRGDIAFAQSMIETGWLSFPSNGQIRGTFNNFSGLFAFNGRPTGTTCAAETAPSRCFATPALGVRYQIQLLRGYADATTASMSRLIRPPSDRIGIAPNWERFGGSVQPIVWATAPNYGIAVLKLYDDALAYSGENIGCLPYFSGGTGRTTGNGYWIFGTDGAAYPMGTAPDLGNGIQRKAGKIRAAATTPTRAGYWMLGANGGVYAFGDAGWRGSPHFLHLVAPVNDFTPAADGRGYAISAGDGGVFTFGSQGFFGSLGGKPLPFPIAGIERSASGNGYWLVATDGGVYHFGDAVWHGSLRALHSPIAIVDMARTATGAGYYLLRADGKVYAYGDAQDFGDIGGCGLGIASRIEVTPTGQGYWIATSTGAVVAFGDARPLGMPATTTASVAALSLQG